MKTRDEHNLFIILPSFAGRNAIMQPDVAFHNFTICSELSKHANYMSLVRCEIGFEINDLLEKRTSFCMGEQIIAW